MDTKELERFCPRARVHLIDAVKSRCYVFGLDNDGRTEFDPTADIVKGRVLSAEEKAQRAELYRRIEAAVAKAQDDRTAPDGYETFCESMAYTWFNRFAAIRYMEVNGYLPCGVRMLSRQPNDPSEPYDIFDPDCLRMATELDLPGLNQDQVRELLLASNDQELYRLILVAQMNELAEVLPSVFGQVSKADALLLPDNLLSSRDDAVLQPLVEKIERDTWGDVEVLGWMYQFYNSEVKDAFFKSKTKETPATIGPATQLFTPEWIVRYMVENSLGRLWMLNNPQSPLREQMDYYIEPDAAHEDFIKIESPEDITLCDPACGSGHILVYAFKLLFEMYRERGYYKDREIPSLILQKNLSGMEIDPRAAQIASLALAMCACRYDRRFFCRGVTADIKVLEPVVLEEADIDSNSALAARKGLVEALAHLDEVGSLLAPSEDDIVALEQACARASADSLFGANTAEKLVRALETTKALARRFDCVVANPPYMGSSSFGPFMSKWVKKNYPDVKSDLCTCFIERGFGLARDKGYSAMVTMQSWMFLGSFEKMRSKVIDNKTIVSMAHLGPRAFDAIGGEVVNVTADVIYNQHSDAEGSYVRLVDINGSEAKRFKLVEAIQNPACGWFYRRNADTFKQIPGTPIAYWVGSGLLSAFEKGISIEDVSEYTGSPNITGDNNLYLRFFWEIDSSLVGNRWRQYSKGGEFRRWYGNLIHVVDWSLKAREFYYLNQTSTLLPERYWYKSGITYTMLTSGKACFRHICENCIWDKSGPVICELGQNEPLWLAYLNSPVTQTCLDLFNPTMNLQVRDVKALPFLEVDDAAVVNKVKELSNNSVFLSRTDWDSFETSWNFKKSPLL